MGTIFMNSENSETSDLHRLKSQRLLYMEKYKKVIQKDKFKTSME